MAGDDVFALGDAPHAWLLPRMAAAVHHAGAGTTGAVLRAGLPTVGVPFLADQPYWADRLHALGVGPAPVPFAELTAARLAAALRALLDDPAYRSRARALAGTLDAEDGGGTVVTAVERLA